MKTTDIECEVCGAKANDGVSIYRTSPKGGPFVGRCKQHLDNKPDPVVEEIMDVLESKS